MQGLTDRLKDSVEEDIDFAELLSKVDDEKVADN
jgi:hypothetical protein